MKEINKKFHYFLWRGKSPKIKSKTMELDIEDGGLKMINVVNFETRRRFWKHNHFIDLLRISKAIPQHFLEEAIVTEENAH